MVDLFHLDIVRDTSAVHPAGHINRVPPDIVLGFSSSNYSSDHWAHVQPCREKQEACERARAGLKLWIDVSMGLTNLHLKIVEGVLVNVFHLLPQPHGIVSQRQDV